MGVGLLIASIIGSALASTAGSIISGHMASNAQQEANRTNVELANTAHQREVNDLKAAGLNPWLSVNGNGAGGSVVANTAPAAAVQDSSSSIANLLSSVVNLQMLSRMNDSRVAATNERTNMYAANNSAKNAYMGDLARSRTALNKKQLSMIESSLKKKNLMPKNSHFKGNESIDDIIKELSK